MSIPPPADQPASPRPWWSDAVFYEVYVRSFADGDGDGVGDLYGLRERLPYLKDLGVDALWLTPFYRSPMADGGYDVADPCSVDPLFGTSTRSTTLLADAHALGLKVTIDIVPNHTSDRHRDFEAALYGRPGGPERDRYVFRPSRAAAAGRRTTGAASSAARPGPANCAAGSGTCTCSPPSSPT